MNLACRLAASMLLIATPASAVTGEWAVGEHIRLRLVAAPAAGGAVDAAIEIELEPGWKTYWRSPGDAGIPPRFDFSASENAGAATVDYPAPDRLDDGYSVTNVYHDRVVLPVRFAPAHGGGDVRLHLLADLGVCSDICLPVSLEAAVDLPAGEAAGDAMALIDAARNDLPGPAKPGIFEIDGIRRVGGSAKKPVFEAVVAVPDRDALLFAETPSDWYAAPPEPVGGEVAPGRIAYRFEVDRRTATTAIEGAEIRLTLKAGGAATTRSFRLDAADASP